MNNNIIKIISDRKLKKSIDQVLSNNIDLDKAKKIVWGAGVSGKSFVKTYSDLNFSYIIDSRQEKQGDIFEGIEIFEPEKLNNEDKTNTIIFVPTVIHQKISNSLREKGFYNIIIPNQLNTSSIGFNINKKDIHNIFQWLNTNEVDYVYLKEFKQDLNHIKDIDIMVSKRHIEKLLNCKYLYSTPSSDVTYLDISWDRPIGINSELPFYPIHLSDDILNKKNNVYINNIRCLNSRFLLITYITHALIHKGDQAGINKYKEVIGKLQKELELDFDISLNGLWNFLNSTEYFPKIDFIRKWNAYNNSQFLKEKTSTPKNNKPEKVVYVFREYFKKKKNLLKKVIALIQSNGFELEEIIHLDVKNKDIVKQSIRGGVWVDSYQSERAGGPHAIGIFKGLGDQVRVTKEMVRNYVINEMNDEVNCIHSSDDELEALEYIKLLEKLGCLKTQ